jgi:hypothetical protein
VRDRPYLFGLIRQVNHDFIHIAPSPALWRIIALHNGMTGLKEVTGGMPADRLIAAANMAAFPA